jgi:hypothetical protein
MSLAGFRYKLAEPPDAVKEKTMYRPTHQDGPGIGRGQSKSGLKESG